MSRELNVYLCGKKIGMLYENDLLQLSFQYSNDKVFPLSVNLPVRIDEYPHTYAFPFFENLTPEGEAFEILTKDHISGNKIFSVLARFGGDCAGAVAFYKKMSGPVVSSMQRGSKADIKKTLCKISSVKVAKIIDKLPEDPLLTSIDNPPRLSLAGAQSKFAVYKLMDKYYRSDDEHPTTHIIKITNKRFPSLLENELFCMRLAQSMQFDVPYVELKVTKGRPYLEIERYDRYIEKEIVRRIHQEDFCQALGIVSNKKYQSGGGATLKNCYSVIEKYSENILIDVARFIEWIIFNYLIGNTDSHAKNFALLHSKAGIRLAPFYDLLSTEVYSQKLVDHSMAMLINGKGKYDSLKPADFVALFGQLGLNATNMMKSVKNKFNNIIFVAENLRENLAGGKITQENISTTSIYNDIIEIIKKRWNKLFR